MNSPKAKLLLALWLLGLPWAMAGPRAVKRVQVSDSGRELGTSYHASLWVAPGRKKAARAALQTIRKKVRKLEQRFSEWKTQSEISRINRLAGAKKVKLSAPMAKLLRGAVHVSKVTGGAFDITWAPWGWLWKKAEAEQKLPSAAAFRAIKARVGWRKLRLSGGSVRFGHRHLKLGIAGVAKGWIIDAAFHGLVAAGFRHVTVNIGGDLRTRGLGKAGKKRRFWIANPYRAKTLVGFIEVKDVAIATSGNYLRYRTIGKTKYGHIVDPRTGRPPAFDGSVTVLTRDAAMADALATALFVMGPQRGLALVRRIRGLEAIYCTRKGLKASLTGIQRKSTPPASR